MNILHSGTETFTVDDLFALVELVSAGWLGAADCDWSAPAATVEWSCLATADHAVDCVYAPAMFLASRRVDAYPEVGLNVMLGADATPARLVESLRIAAQFVSGVVHDAPDDVRAVIFRRPSILVGEPPDFVPRAAVELMLHAHDIAAGLGIEFEPPPDLCRRLREHTRPWPMWGIYWKPLGDSDDPWGDLLTASGRAH